MPHPSQFLRLFCGARSVTEGEVRSEYSLRASSIEHHSVRQQAVPSFPLFSHSGEYLYVEVGKASAPFTDR